MPTTGQCGSLPPILDDSGGLTRGERAMRLCLPLLCLVGFVVSTNAALAVTADDVKWINQCIKDNKGDAKEDVVRKYCVCMNNKMDDNETQSITQWEKTHPKERAACDRDSGWK
jgi:hypothetical protein